MTFLQIKKLFKKHFNRFRHKTLKKLPKIIKKHFNHFRHKTLKRLPQIIKKYFNHFRYKTYKRLPKIISGFRKKLIKNSKKRIKYFFRKSLPRQIKKLSIFFLLTNGPLKKFVYKKLCENSYMINFYRNIIIDKKKRQVIFYIDNPRAYGHMMYDFFLANTLALKRDYDFIIVRLSKEFHYLFENTNIEKTKIITKKNLSFVYFYYKKKVCDLYFRRKFSFKQLYIDHNLKYFNKKIFKNELKISFSDEDITFVNNFLKKINPHNKKIVVLNNRSTAVSVNKNLLSEKSRSFDKNIFNKLIENYKEYFFIKVGLPEQENLNDQNYDNYYDLSNSGLWSQKLETLFIYKSEMCIFPTSGSNFLPRFFKKYMLTINLICPYLHYPINDNEIGLYQKILKDGKILTIKDYYEEKNLSLYRKDSKEDNIEMLKNTQDEICESFKELIDFKENRMDISKRNLAEYLRNELIKGLPNARKSDRIIYKWTGDDKDLGNGLLSGNNLTV